MVLADMEMTGFLVDASGIKAYGEKLQEELQEIQEKIFKIVGKNFNINSPKQLGLILFEEMKLPKGKRLRVAIQQMQRFLRIFVTFTRLWN